MHVMPSYIDGGVQSDLGYDSPDSWPSSYHVFREHTRQRYDGPRHICFADMHQICQGAAETLEAFATPIPVATRKANSYVVTAP